MHHFPGCHGHSFSDLKCFGTQWRRAGLHPLTSAIQFDKPRKRFAPDSVRVRSRTSGFVAIKFDGATVSRSWRAMKVSISPSRWLTPCNFVAASHHRSMDRKLWA